jgi:integrase/recombinase XerD
MTPLFISDFSPYMKDMLEYKEALGFSRSSYQYKLMDFDKFCVTHFPHETTLSKEMVWQWARLRPTETANGLKRRMIAIRELGKYMNCIGIPAYVIPTDMIGNFKRYVPHIFTDFELSSFFYAADHFKTDVHQPAKEYIVPVMFRLLYCCGLRPNEVRTINHSDINLETGKLDIRETKMHKDRAVMLAPDILKLCRNYDGLIRSPQAESEYFFPHPYETTYSPLWLQYQFWKCWKLAGINEFQGSHPRVYDFRHNYATRILQQWMENGRDLYTWLPYLSAYMGHADFSDTAYYIHLLPEHLTRSEAVDWSRFSDLIPEVTL